MDLGRAPAERGSLGRFLAALGDGTGGLTVQRSSAASFETLVNSPLTVLALAGALLVWFALLQPWGGLMRLFGIYPAIRAAMAGTAVAAVIGGLLGPGRGWTARLTAAVRWRSGPVRWRFGRWRFGRWRYGRWRSGRWRFGRAVVGRGRDRVTRRRYRVRHRRAVGEVLPWNPVDRVITSLIGSAVCTTATDDTGAGLGPFSTDDQAHIRHRRRRLLAG
ncbi:hypothetical protein [Verrucosispora sioxanthis]|uniref:hypothetical protein n=1 Tax=Verrucosispora sioxanthis TaxID=2499994 RepID=UPI004039765E